MEEVVEVDVHCWVDEGPGGAADFCVVALAGEVGGYLLHVGFPVDFGV